MFDVFSSPRKTSVVDEVRDYYVLPAAVCRPETRHLTFCMEPQSCYLLLQDSRFEIELQIKINGQNIAAPSAGGADGAGLEHSAGFDNLIGANIIKNLQLYLNDELVSAGNDLYGISAYVIAILSLDEETMEHKWSEAGLTFERSPQNTSFTAIDGYRTRLLRSQGSGIVRISCPLFVNLFLSGKCLLPMTQLKIEMTLQEPGYVIKSGRSAANRGGLQYTIANPRLLFRRIKTSSEFQIQQEKRLISRGYATYHVPNFSTRQLIIPAQLSEYCTNDVFQSSFIPDYCIIFLADHAESVGTTGTSVFSFRQFNVSEISLVMGDTVLTQEVDFANSKFLGAFRRFCQDTWSDSVNNISLDCWLKEHTFFVFDMGQLPCGNHERKLGTCELRVKFSATTNPLLKLYIFTSERGRLTVTASRKWTRHF